MEKSEKLKILLPVLIAVTIFVWVRALRGPESKRGVEKDILGIKVSGGEGELTSLALLSAARGKRAKSPYANWGRNPFTVGTPDKTDTKLILEGIVWDDKSPKAIISDEIVGIGDKIAGNTVVDITKESAILTDGTRNFELKLEY